MSEQEVRINKPEIIRVLQEQAREKSRERAEVFSDNTFFC